MTRWFVDNREIKPPAEASSLSQVLKYIDTDCLAPHCAVMQIMVQGRPFFAQNSSWSAENPEIHSVEKADKVEIFTGNIGEIARSSVSEALVYLERVETITLYLTNSFRTNAVTESFVNLRQLYDGFYLLHLLLEKIQADFGIRLEEFWTQKGYQPGYHEKLIPTLKRLIESQEKGDLLRLADLLEEEILPLVPLWREVFQVVAKTLL
jgi:hypothetical protein